MPTLEITTNVGCPVDCTFCPQPAIQAAYDGPRMMSLEDFRTILSRVPKYVRIDFSGMAEPWANPDCTQMLRIALQEGYSVAVYTTLIGMKDHSEVISLLRAHAEKVEIIVIHLPDAHGNMRGFRATRRYKIVLGAMLNLARSRLIKEFRFMAMGVPVQIEPIDDEDLDGFVGIDRAGALDVAAIGEQEAISVSHGAPVSCSFTPFYDQNVVLPSGDVVLCCMDYSLKHKIGNLLKGDYFDLFDSYELAMLRTQNMQFGCIGSICKSCVRAQVHHLEPRANQFWKSP